MKKGGLGKGLSALIPEKKVAAERGEAGILQLELGQIKGSRYQPREALDPERLRELIASIKEKGLVQPILVRATEEGYELICGERRLSAARALGMATIPAIVRQATDLEALELSLIENLQREDLNPIEQAHAYRRLIDEFGMIQDELAKVLGKDRTSISNTIRLLKLPESVQNKLSQGKLSVGHAIAILSLSSPTAQVKLSEVVIARGLSVRATEQLVKKKVSPRKEPTEIDPEIVTMQEELQQLFGTQVKIRPSRKGGRIEIEYYSDEDLNRILEFLRRSRR